MGEVAGVVMTVPGSEFSFASISSEVTEQKALLTTTLYVPVLEVLAEVTP